MSAISGSSINFHFSFELQRQTLLLHNVIPPKRARNYKIKVVTFLILCFTTVAVADDFKLVSGKEYKNVTVTRVEPDGIILKTKSGISKIYFLELPTDVQERFHYNVAIASAYSAQQAVNLPRVAAAHRGEPIKVISHGTQVDINQHVVLGNVTLVDFYADWCGPCRQLSPCLEQMARNDPEIALRKIDIVTWKTAVAQQFNIHSIPQVNVYDRSGRLIGTVLGVDFEKVKSYVAQAKSNG
jgi:thiol-disulfide isomerase/thioredoxin